MKKTFFLLLTFVVIGLGLKFAKNMLENDEEQIEIEPTIEDDDSEKISE